MQNPTVTFTVTAETLEEAAQFAVEQMQDLTTQGGHRGFMLPKLTAEFILADPWRRCYEFTGEFLLQP